MRSKHENPAVPSYPHARASGVSGVLRRGLAAYSYETPPPQNHIPNDRPIQADRIPREAFNPFLLIRQLYLFPRQKNKTYLREASEQPEPSWTKPRDTPS